jgi:hypothetical protein
MIEGKQHRIDTSDLTGASRSGTVEITVTAPGIQPHQLGR